MRWLRTRLSVWLGVVALFDQIIVLSTELEEERNARQKLQDSVHGLAQALQATVAQLNRNTVIMQRWAKESATLEAIERRHAVKNGNGRILTVPPGASIDGL